MEALPHLHLAFDLGQTWREPQAMAAAKPLDLKTFVKRKDFRSIARTHLADAKRCLAEEGDRHLYYAALEIRKCMEAIIYETAKLYVDDIPEEDYSTWQPARLLAMLIEIDPMADKSGEMRFAREDGKEPKVWRSLGTDKRLTLAEIRHNYDALGFFLHTLTIHQLWKGKTQKIDRLRARSQDLVARLEDVLSARAWNFNINQTATLECNGCGKPIKRRLGRLKGPSSAGDAETITVNCFHCAASYQLSLTEEGGVLWQEELEDVPCPYDDCDHTIGVWKRDVQPGTKMRCAGCDRVSIFGLGVWPLPEDSGVGA